MSGNRIECVARSRAPAGEGATKDVDAGSIAQVDLDYMVPPTELKMVLKDWPF